MEALVTIEDRAAAAVFTAPRHAQTLLWLVPRALSLSELGRLTQTPLNLLHHHVRKWVQLGLVRVVREKRRAGAPMKYYQATARAFFVPAELAADKGARRHARMRALLTQRHAQRAEGTVFSHDGKGPQMRRVGAAERPTAVELWLEVRLSDTDAAALAKELSALLGRFRARATGAHQRYLVHAAIAPE